MDSLSFSISLLAVFIVGVSKGGFGGGLAMLGVPLMSLAMSPVQAAAILLPVLCFMDLLALKAYWRQWSAQQLRRLLPAAFIGISIGAFSFKYLNADAIRLLIGVIAVGFALDHLLTPFKRRAAQQPGARAAGFWGSLAGFTSFVAHSGGPPLNVYLLPQQLEKTVFQATSVAVFLAVNYVKLLPYAWLGQFHSTNLMQSLWLLPIAALGIWTGVKLHQRVSTQLFFRLAYVFLFATGLKLMYDGLTRTLL